MYIVKKYGQGFGILFRSYKFLSATYINLTSDLLQTLKKMADPRPIFFLGNKETSLSSLNNNLGTLTLVLGYFPFDIQP